MNLKSLELFGILFIVLIGTFLHFAYDLSNQNQFVALIAPVNESVWEHVKMLFYAYLIYSTLEHMFVGEKFRNFLFANMVGVVVSCLLLIMLYYGYTSFIDSNIYFDIFIFIMAIIVGQLVSLAIIKSRLHFTGLNFLALLALVAGILLFSSYTYEPPHTELFIDQNTNTYGINK